MIEPIEDQRSERLVNGAGVTPPFVFTPGVHSLSGGMSFPCSYRRVG
jgi:hypothetical protein